MIYKTLHKKLNTKQHEPTKRRDELLVLQKGKQYLLHMWHPSLCYSYYKPGVIWYFEPHGKLNPGSIYL